MMRKLIAAAMLIVLLILCGCSGSNIFSDFHELDKLEVIRTIGIDKAEDGVTVTVGTGTETEDKQPHVFTYSAHTVSQALSRLQTTPAGNFMFFAHTEHILIGEDAAREGIRPFLDFIERTTEMRLETDIFVVRGGTASELMASCAEHGSSATDMLTFLHEDIKNLGEGYVFTCEDVAASLAGHGTALCMAVEKTATESLTESGSMAAPAGFAVLDRGRLAGYLTDEETKGAALLLEKVDFESIPVTVPDGTVSLGLTGESVRVSPVFDGDDVERIDVNISVRANIEEAAGSVEVTSPVLRTELGQILSRTAANRAAAAIERARKMKLDFLDTGGMALRTAPVQFEKYAETWETDFTDIPYNIYVTSVIRGTYDIDNAVPVTAEGER